jgi:hypothetical protein
MAIPGNVGGKKSTFSSPAAMAQAQRAAESQSMKALQDRREQTRKDIFKGRQDISNNRLDRRQIQSDLYEKFKQEQMKPVVGASNVYQSRTPGGPTLADEAMRLANMYGPTFKEIGSDIGYGLGSIGKGIGDFIGRGGVLGSVASDLFQRIKSGTQQGIETVGGLYDNLRSAFSGQPTVNYGGGSTITTTTNQPAIDLTPASIETEILPSMDLNRNIGDESDPSIFGIENPLFRDTQYEPINVQDMDMSGVNSLQLSEVNPQQRKMLDQYLFNKMIQEEINRNKQQKFNRDMQMYQTNPTGQPVLMVENVGLPSLMDSYNFAKNPQVETPMGNLRFDNVLSGNPQLGYGNTVMINGVPVDLNTTIGNQGLSVGGSFSFKKGGSVDKYAGLGYKLK